MEIELERTFLLKEFPKGLENCKSFEILDIYIPQEADHPTLRIRRIGEDRFEMTKKQPIKNNDSSEQREETISLSKEEFSDLSVLSGKRLKKKRYYYNNDIIKAEIDVFLDDFSGLVLVDFEFTSSKEKEDFIMPDFCLAEVTQEESIAAGFLSGKKYSDIEPFLNKYNYKKIDNYWNKNKVMKYNKLVRDKIPEIIKDAGKEAITHIADNEEYWEKLKEKLQEEVNEFLAENNKEELADILEVIYAICDFKEIDKEELESLRKEKAEKRGAFRDKIILDES